MPLNNFKFPSKLLWPTLALMSAVPLVLASQTSSNHVSSMELSSFRGSLRSILLPIEDIKLSAGAAGIISSYLVDEGKRVSAGDIILELDTQEDVVGIMQSEALLDGTEAELEKTRKDFARSLTTPWRAPRFSGPESFSCRAVRKTSGAKINTSFAPRPRTRASTETQRQKRSTLSISQTPTGGRTTHQ